MTITLTMTDDEAKALLHLTTQRRRGKLVQNVQKKLKRQLNAPYHLKYPNGYRSRA